MSAPNDELLQPPDLAEWLQIPLATIYQWRARGVGPRACKIGRHLRYRRSDVERWIESNADPRTVTS